MGLGQSEHFLPFTGAWQAGHGNPEPDKQHLCSRLDPCQAASFPGADLMFLKSLKTPEVCVSLLVQYCCQQRQRPRMGPGGHVEGWTPRAQASDNSPLPCPACGMQAPLQKKQKIHCLSSEMRPLVLCLPAPNHLKVSLKETFTLRLFCLFQFGLLEAEPKAVRLHPTEVLSASQKSAKEPQRELEGSSEVCA